jgi:hypothetical protein
MFVFHSNGEPTTSVGCWSRRGHLSLSSDSTSASQLTQGQPHTTLAFKYSHVPTRLLSISLAVPWLVAHHILETNTKWLARNTVNSKNVRANRGHDTQTGGSAVPNWRRTRGSLILIGLAASIDLKRPIPVSHSGWCRCPVKNPPLVLVNFCS